MNKTTLYGLAWLVTANLFVKLAWLFFIDRGIQNTVGAAAYGVYFELLAFSFIGQALLDFGLSQYNNRAIAQNNALLPIYLPNMIAIKLLLSGVYIALLVSIAYFFRQYDAEQWRFLGWVCANQALASFLLYCRSNLQALHYFKHDSIVSVADRLIAMFICLAAYFFAPQQFGLPLFIYSQTFGLIVAIFLSFLFLEPILQNNLTVVSITPKINFGMFRRIIREGLPFALLTLLMSIYSRIDTVLLHDLLPEFGKQQAGVYAAAYRLLDASNTIPLLFANVLLPVFARQLAEGQSVSNTVGWSLRLLASGTIALAAIGMGFKQPIMYTLYPAATQEYTTVFGYLIAIVSISALACVYGCLLSANGNMRQLNSIAFVGVVLNIALNLVLIPSYQSIGAATAALITQFVMGILYLAYAYKLLSLPTNFLLIMRILGYTALCFAIAFWAAQTDYGAWQWRAVIASLGCVVAAFSLGLVSLELLQKMRTAK